MMRFARPFVLAFSVFTAMPAFADHAPNDMLLRDLPDGSRLAVRRTMDLSTNRVINCSNPTSSSPACINRLLFSEGKSLNVPGSTAGLDGACIITDMVVGDDLVPELASGSYPITESRVSGSYHDAIEVALGDSVGAAHFRIVCVSRSDRPTVGSLRRALGWANVMIALPDGMPGYETAEGERRRAAEEEASMWDDMSLIPWY